MNVVSNRLYVPLTKQQIELEIVTGARFWARAARTWRQYLRTLDARLDYGFQYFMPFMPN